MARPRISATRGRLARVSVYNERKVSNKVQLAAFIVLFKKFSNSFFQGAAPSKNTTVLVCHLKVDCQAGQK